MDGTPMEINMLVEKKYSLVKELLEKVLNLHPSFDSDAFRGQPSEELLPQIHQELERRIEEMGIDLPSGISVEYFTYHSVAASGIAISSDSAEESVGTSTARIILFGTIPTAIPATIPIVDLPNPYEVTVAQWRSRVAARSSPPSSPTDMTLPISQILLAPPSLPRRLAVLVLPGQPIPIDRPYRTQTNAVHDSSSDSSSDSLLGYSSDTSLVPIATPISEALSPVRADLLPPRKRIRGFVSTTNFEVSSKESYGPYTEPDFDIPPTALDVSYTVELADGRIA
ncbi:hypothetical protein Tco_0714833 [Tanacetum coccineum]